MSKSHRCVVYNASHEPLAVVPAERALVLYLEDKVIILDSVKGECFHSAGKQEFPIPTKVVMKKYQSTGARYYSEAVKNQRNMFVRDDYTCRYCMRSFGEFVKGDYLTRDHVYPQALGGPDDWENIVTACSKCNHSKDDRTLDQFEEYIAQQVREESERLSRMTDKKRSKKTEERIEYLKRVLLGIADVREHPPKVPTVFEIMMKRSTNPRPARVA